MKTPAYIVDAEAIMRNVSILETVKARTGCRILLALKAFSMPAAFPYFQGHLDGSCASSVHEARLGVEQFGGETHAFAAAFSQEDMVALLDLEVDHVTLNSFAQLETFRALAQVHPHGKRVVCGLRINPEHSEGHSPIYDPCAPQSRLGIRIDSFAGQSLEGVTGLHCHNLCEQNADAFVRTLAAIEQRFGGIIDQMSWMNFGGGHHITRDDYDVDALCNALNGFKKRHPSIKTIYLEPGEACVLNAGSLVTRVLDLTENQGSIAILDMSCACHTPDVIEGPYRPRVFRQHDWQGAAMPSAEADHGFELNQSLDHPYGYRLAGPTCLAGDIIGDYAFAAPLQIGDLLIFEDMALYTMVKNNTFNGINLPDIVLRKPDGALQTIRTFGYSHFIERL